MKQALRLTFVAALALTMLSCSKKYSFDESLEVTANHISGTWMLEQWSGGSLADGTYVYVEFTRRDQQFTMYDNIGSFSARRRTGRYNITISNGASVIQGQYHYGTGDWQHRYIITDLTSSSMTWTAVDNASDVSVYRRCEAVPEDILAELPATE